VYRCWEWEPAHRPKASEIVEILEGLLKNSFTEIIKAHPIMFNPNFSTLRDFYEAAYRKSNYINTGTSSDQKSLKGNKSSFFSGISHFLNRNNPFSWITTAVDKNNRDDSNEIRNHHESDYENMENRLSDPVANTNNDRIHEQSHSSSSSSSSKSIFGNIPSSFRYTSQSNTAPGTGPYRDGNGRNENDDSEYILPNYISKKNMLNIIMPPAAMEAIGLIKQEKYWYELEITEEPWAIFTNEYPFILIHATSKWYELFNVPSSFGIDYQLLSLISLIHPEVEASHLFCTSSNTYIQAATTTNTYRQMRGTSAKDVISQLKAHNEVHNILCLHLPYMNRKPTNGNNISSNLSSANLSTSNKLNTNRIDFNSSSDNGIDSSSHSEALLQQAFSVDTTGRLHGHNMMCSIHAYPVFPSQPILEADLLAGATHGDSSKDNRSSPVKGSSSPFSPKSPSQGLSPAAVAASSGPASRLTFRKSEKSLGAQPPMYYAVLFNELREQEIHHPQLSVPAAAAPNQPTSRFNTKASTKSNRFHSHNSRVISDITMGTSVNDLASEKGDDDDEEQRDHKYENDGNTGQRQGQHQRYYYENEFDEIYDTELDSNLTNRSDSVNQPSFWGKVSRFWTFNGGSSHNNNRLQSTQQRGRQDESQQYQTNPIVTTSSQRQHSIA
jgi:hypothetical protein